MKEDVWAIGVDLGGTKIEMAQVDSRGKILEKLRTPTDVKGGYEAIENQIIKGVKELKEKTKSDPVGVGVGVAGQIDSDTGLVHFAPNLSWHEIPLRENLRSKFDLPVSIVNDVRAATWGEWIHGAGKGCKHFICIFLGTGIGGGVVSNGQMMKGCTNSAGEVGHTTVDLYGPSCSCGNRGCMEAIAGGWAIARSAKEAAITSPEAAKKMLELAHDDVEALSAKLVIEAAREGDPLAQEIVEKALEALVAGCISLVNAFNPCRLIFGGGLTNSLTEVGEVVDLGVKQRALKAATESLEVVSAQLGYEAGVIGAATFAIYEHAKGDVWGKK